MPPNLSDVHSFGLLLRNSNLLTEQLMNMLRIVILTLTCIFICCAFAGDSYQESKPGNEKHKSKVSGSCIYFHLPQPERMSTFGLR